MLVFVFFYGCKKKDSEDAVPFIPRSVEIQENDRISTYDYDSLYRIVKITRTHKFNNNAFYTFYTYSGDVVYHKEIYENGASISDTIQLDSAGHLMQTSYDSITFNNDGYITSMGEESSIKYGAEYLNGNLIEEWINELQMGPNIYRYDFYTDKEDKYRLNSLLVSPYLISSKQLLSPIYGKASINLIKAIKDVSVNKTTAISYKFDSNGFPNTVIKIMDSDTSIIKVTYK